MIKVLLLNILLALTCIGGLSQNGSENKIRIYSYPMDPRQHPDDNRRMVKPPDSGTFGNQIQFMALRSLDGGGFITETPFGDAADCLLSDCPLWLMQQYSVIIIGSRLKGGHEIKDKLEALFTKIL